MYNHTAILSSYDVYCINKAAIETMVFKRKGKRFWTKWWQAFLKFNVLLTPLHVHFNSLLSFPNIRTFPKGLLHNFMLCFYPTFCWQYIQAHRFLIPTLPKRTQTFKSNISHQWKEDTS